MTNSVKQALAFDANVKRQEVVEQLQAGKLAVVIGFNQILTELNTIEVLQKEVIRLTGLVGQIINQ